MSSGTGAPTKVPKTMSSRLLTMKFMQRAAAAPSPSPFTSDQQPSPKRHKSENSALADSTTGYLVDERAVQAALAEDESKRQSALERQAAEAGDTRWVLRFEDEKKSSNYSHGMLRVVHTEFSAIDGSQGGSTVASAEAQNIGRPAIEGRRSYGRFNRAIEKLRDPTAEDSSDSDSNSGSEDGSENSADSSSDDPASTLIKSERENALKKLKFEQKAKRKEDRVEALRLAEKQKGKEVKLNRLQSISSRSTSKNQACHTCGDLGHRAAVCPEKNHRRNGDGERLRGLKKSR